MTAKVYVADELRAVLSGDDVRRLIAARNTTDVRCVACGRGERAGSPDKVNVVVLRNAAEGVPVVWFAHQRCSESGFVPGRAPLSADSLDGGRLAARFRVRQHPSSPAVLLWEPYQQLRVGGEDVHTRFYRWLGLRSSRHGLLGTSGPWLQTLMVRLTPAHASVALTAQGVKAIVRKVRDQPQRVKAGEEMDGFPLTPTPPIVEWRQAAERTGRCLLVTGTGLGLEHPSLEREDLLLEEGLALAGVAPVRAIADRDGGW